MGLRGGGTAFCAPAASLSRNMEKARIWGKLDPSYRSVHATATAVQLYSCTANFVCITLQLYGYLATGNQLLPLVRVITNVLVPVLGSYRYSVHVY